MIAEEKHAYSGNRQFLCGKPARQLAIEVTVNLTAL
jgi:hypothetical protein